MSDDVKRAPPISMLETEDGWQRTLIATLEQLLEFARTEKLHNIFLVYQVGSQFPARTHTCTNRRHIARFASQVTKSLDEFLAMALDDLDEPTRRH